MSHGTRFAVLGLVALALAAFAWSWGAEDVPAPVASGADNEATADVDVDAAAADAPAIERHAAPAIVEPVPAPLEHPFAFDLQIEVRDRDGLPLERAVAWLAPSGCALDRVPEPTGPDGIAHAQWHGKQSEMELVLRIDGQPTLHRVAAHAGSVQRVVVEGQGRGSDVRWKVAVANQKVYQTQRKSAETRGYLGTKLIGLQGPGDLRMQTGLHPFAVFADALVPAVARLDKLFRRASLDNAEVAVLERAYTKKFAAARSADSAAEFAKGLKALAAAQAVDGRARTVLEGTVYDDQGRPAKNATVCWGEAVDLPVMRTSTDEHGNYRFDKVTDGWHELRAGGRDDGLDRMRVYVAAATTTRWDAHLRRQTSFRGRAVDPQDKPLADWTVEVVGGGEPWFDATTVRADGTFELPNQPGPMATLLLRHADDATKLPVAVLGPVLPDSGELLFRFDPAATRGALRIEPIVPAGLEVQVEVRVWQEETGRGAPMDRAAKTQVHSLGGLPAGWYRLEVGAASLGWTSAGRHWVDGRSTVSLGRLLLPEPGTVRIVHAEGSVPDGENFEQQICRQGAACDLRVEDASAARTGAVALPAGDYWLLWKDVRGRQHLRPFAVAAGRETVVDSSQDAGR